MKRVFSRKVLFVASSLSLLTVAAVLVVIGLANTAAAPAPTHLSHEVAILSCVTEADTDGPSIVVDAYDATEGAPVIKVGTSCAQALKTLLDADFTFEPDRTSTESSGCRYTLIKVAPPVPPTATPTATTIPGETPAPTPTLVAAPTPGATPVATPVRPTLREREDCYDRCTSRCGARFPGAEQQSSRDQCIQGCSGCFSAQ